MADLCSRAIELAQEGFRVLPLASGTRVPKGLKNWQRKATSDITTIQKLWKRLPSANVGIATGHTFIVLDVDVKNNKPGLKTLSELRRQYQLPKTYTVKTPSGGLHLYYRHPYPLHPENGPKYKQLHRAIQNITNWPAGIAASQSGIDIRADGGQVVAPGMQVSDFPGKSYEVVFNIPMAELPGTLIKHLPFKEMIHVHEAENSSGSSEAGQRQDSDLPVQVEASTRSGLSSVQGVSGATESGASVLASIPNYARQHPGVGTVPIGRQSATAAGLVTNDISDYTTLPDCISAGSRDDTLFRFMCSWRERQYPIAHAEILATTLHSRLEQPANDIITLTAVLAKLHRTYKTYTPSAIDAAAIQAITPSDPLEELTEVVLEPQQTVTTVAEALNRFVLCVETHSVIDTTKHPAYANIKMESFKAAYGNVGLRTSSRANAKIIALPKLWLEHKNRQTVDDYGYQPNGPKVYNHLGARFYNKWAPSELALRLKEDSNQSDPSQLDPFWRHMDFLFGSDEEEKQAFWRWLAYSVRYPERRVAHGVLLVSEPGVGKSWFYKLLQALLGVYEVNTASNNELDSSFNDWVFGCSMVVIHELMTGNRQHMMQQLLSLITEERILINAKHKQPRMRNIYANFLCFSNHANAAAIATKDRRFFVYQSAAAKASSQYYKELFGWLDTEGPYQLLKHIHQLDLSDYNPGEAPMSTAAKQRMEYTNLSIVQQAIVDAIEDKSGPFVSDIVGSEVVEKYLESIMEISQKDRSVARIAIANVCPPLKQARYRFKGDSKQHRLRAIRNGQHWAKANTAAVLEEYTKALAAVSMPVMKLEVVK